MECCEVSTRKAGRSIGVVNTDRSQSPRSTVRRQVEVDKMKYSGAVGKPFGNAENKASSKSVTSYYGKARLAKPSLGKEGRKVRCEK